MGRHDMKFGARYSRHRLSNPIWSDMNGSYQFRGQGDIKFNPANPRSYPERLTIRVLGPSDYEMMMHVGEFFAQDKWQIKPGLTLSAGVRYDIEVFPYDRIRESARSAAAPKYPVDKNNIAPRLGLVWNPDGESKSVVRPATACSTTGRCSGTVDNFLTDLKYARVVHGELPASGRRYRPAQRAVSRPIRR